MGQLGSARHHRYTDAPKSPEIVSIGESKILMRTINIGGAAVKKALERQVNRIIKANTLSDELRPVTQYAMCVEARGNGLDKRDPPLT
jgi:hypothetical protein